MASPSRSKTPRPGTWVVLGLVALGVIAGVVSVTYWIGVDRRTFPGTQPAGAGAAPWDPKAARAELEEVRDRFDQTAGKGNLKPVLRDATRLVERYPNYAEARTLLAQVLLFDKQLRPAYEQLRLSLAIDKQQADVQHAAGNVADQLGDLETAAQHYNLAVNLAPRETRYRVFLANAYLKLKETERARATLVEALNIDSSMHEGYAMLSEVYAQENKLPLAVEQIQKAIEHTPVSERKRQVDYVLRKAALLRRDNRADEALQTLAGLTDKERREPEALRDAALCWSAMGDFGKAAEVYEAALADDPMEWRLAADAARWRIKAGDKAGAKRNIEAIRKINSKLDVIAELEKQAAAIK